MSLIKWIRNHPKSSVALFGCSIAALILGKIGYSMKQTYDEMHQFSNPKSVSKTSFGHVLKLSNGLKLEYSEFGDLKGKPLLVIPGYFCSRYYELFIHLEPWIKKEKYHIIVPSLPGSGDSNILSESMLKNPQQYMDEIISALRKLVAHTNLTRTTLMEGFKQDMHTPLTATSSLPNSDDSYSPFTPFPSVEPLNILSFDLGAKITLSLIEKLTNHGIAIENVTFISPHITTKPLLEVAFNWWGPFVLNASISDYITNPNVPDKLKPIATAEAAYYLKNGYYGVLSFVNIYDKLPMPTPEELAEFVVENPSIAIKVMEGGGIEQPKEESEIPFFSFSSGSYFTTAKRTFHDMSKLSREQILASYEESIQSKDPSSPPDPEMKRIQKILARFDMDYKENQINEHLFYFNAKEIISLAMGSQLLYLTPV